MSKEIGQFWLGIRDVKRDTFWFILKLLSIVTWGIIILNILFVRLFKIDFHFDIIQASIFNILLYLGNSVLFILIFTIFYLTTKRRQTEFGLLRALGATKSEVFKLILQEGIILPIISSLIILIIELLLILNFKIRICGLLKISYNFAFFKIFFLSFIITVTFQFIIYFIMLLPFAFYFGRKDPYTILRY